MATPSSEADDLTAHSRDAHSPCIAVLRLYLFSALASLPPLSVCPEIGAGLTGFGSLFLVLGVILLFDKALLALGNVRQHTTHEGGTDERSTQRAGLHLLTAC